MNSFNFTQGSASATWTIVHNLDNAAPNVDVFLDVSGTLYKVIPLNIIADSANQVTVEFSSAQIGAARVTA